MTDPAAPGRGLSRRQFLGRAAALGLSASAGGLLLGACRAATSETATPTKGPTSSQTPGAGDLPIVVPTPTSATYGSMLEATELIGVGLPAALLARLTEIAADAGAPLGTDLRPGSRQAQVELVVDAALDEQAYRLDLTPTEDGPAVRITAGGDPGALYGLVSLGQLAVADGAGLWLRQAAIDDAPGFVRRGAILDPAPRTGVSTPASRTELLDRVKLGVRHKLNFVDLPGRTPWPDLVRYCDDHHVELMVAWGYQDQLTRAPRRDLKNQLAVQQDAGARSIALSWDDIPTDEPERLAAEIAGVFNDLYRYLRLRDPDVRLSTVLPPYGGVPGDNLVFSSPGEGERFLDAIRPELPDDVRVFWTGDGGVFSETVTKTGAGAYRDAVGHELGLWDNNTLWNSRDREACSGRAPDLGSVVSTYMGNLVGEPVWTGTNGEFALLTSLFYAWNPPAYDPAAAGAAADAILGA